MATMTGPDLAQIAESAGAGNVAPVPGESVDSVHPVEPHVATTYFATRLRELMAGFKIRDLDSGRVSKLSPLRLQRILKEQAPHLALSQSQFYRYVNGEAAPDVAVVYELAVLFDVSPTYFVPAEILPA